MTIRLWAHETTRVLGDRLINDEDRLWMLNNISEITRLSFGQNFDMIFKHLDDPKDADGKITTIDEFRGNLFGDIMAQFGLVDRPYEEL
jgi:dynein heavy chain, axonemal